MNIVPARPSTADVDRIASMPDPVLRNLCITQCYHDLSLAFAARAGLQANWCTFATWASKQAGQTIRGEDLARALSAAAQAQLAPAQAAERIAATARALGAQGDSADIEAVVWAALDPAAAVARASDAVARGNLKVFEEIAREFARFCSTCLHDDAPDADHLARFGAALRPGEPPTGQRHLRQAFTHYYQALFEPAAKARLELLLLANLEIGFHEQTRLQPEIAAALDAGFIDPADFRRRILAAIFPYHGWLVRLRLTVAGWFGGRSPLDRAFDAFVDVARQQAHVIITEHMMTLSLPGGVHLRLGDDLTAQFPEALRHVEHPQLQALLAQVDPTPDSTAGTGAVDWSDLPERLHFIADMFRCYADTPSLFERPFTPDQIATIEAGQIPDGVL